MKTQKKDENQFTKKKYEKCRKTKNTSQSSVLTSHISSSPHLHLHLTLLLNSEAHLYLNSEANWQIHEGRGSFWRYTNNDLCILLLLLGFSVLSFQILAVYLSFTELNRQQNVMNLLRVTVAIIETNVTFGQVNVYCHQMECLVVEMYVNLKNGR